MTPEDKAEQAWRVDCHIHTFRSGDSRLRLAELEDTAVAAGLAAVCITDHGTTAGALEAAESFERVRVVVGQECRTWAGEIIGLFLSERIPGNLKPAEVVERIKSQGGLVYLPHPFCPSHAGLRQPVVEELIDDIDIVEVHNAKASTDAANEEAARFAAAHGKAAAAGSDAHYREFVGRAYVELPPFDGAVEFLAALRDGRIEPGRYTLAEASWPVSGQTAG